MALDRAEAVGPASQKKSLHAAEQERERVQAQRQFWQRESRYIDPAQLVFVDESGITTEMTRRYGRALHGARVEGVKGLFDQFVRVMEVAGFNGARLRAASAPAYAFQGSFSGLLSRLPWTPHYTL
jgi:hypothetical protein